MWLVASLAHCTALEWKLDGIVTSFKLADCVRDYCCWQQRIRKGELLSTVHSPLKHGFWENILRIIEQKGFVAWSPELLLIVCCREWCDRLFRLVMCRCSEPVPLLRSSLLSCARKLIIHSMWLQKKKKKLVSHLWVKPEDTQNLFSFILTDGFIGKQVCWGLGCVQGNTVTFPLKEFNSLRCGLTSFLEGQITENLH